MTSDRIAKLWTDWKLKSRVQAHAETLRAMKPKAGVLVPEYQQAVEI